MFRVDFGVSLPWLFNLLLGEHFPYAEDVDGTKVHKQQTQNTYQRIVAVVSAKVRIEMLRGSLGTGFSCPTHQY